MISLVPFSSATPVAIGGVGGSGTRLVAQCLREMGFFMGSDLNESNDNLLFTLLFKQMGIMDASEDYFRELLEIFCVGMSAKPEFTSRQLDFVQSLALTGRNKLSADWLWQRVVALEALASIGKPVAQSGLWGWKEPSTHVVLPELVKCFPNMKYIHVVRNGLDMAFSSNQNQLLWWGAQFIGKDFERSPRYSLRYWCEVHKRVLRLGEDMGDNFLLLNYDDFCTSKEVGVKNLCDFLKVEVDSSIIHPHLVNLIEAPKSIGRFRKEDISDFSVDDIQYVEQLGFNIV